MSDVVLFSADRVLCNRMQAALVSRATPARPVGTWAVFEREAPRATCAAVAVRWLARDTVFADLCAFKARFADTSLVLITEKDADNARNLKAVLVEEVIWIHDLERDLLQATMRVCRRHLLYEIADRVERSTCISPTLRRSLVYACRADQPICTVAELARAVRRDRSTLWHHWQKAVGRQATARLEDYLDWILLLRAISARGPERPWSCVADELGVHEHTLGRIAKRLTASTLTQLAAEGQTRLTIRFWEQIRLPANAGSSTVYG